MISVLVKVTLLLFCWLTLTAAEKPLPSKEDCISLWNAVGGAGGNLRNVAAKSNVAMGGVLKLYEDCLRSEEGIRYRRNYWSKSVDASKTADISRIIMNLYDQ
ncbi:unnamed protein product [Medioppia subpectinata]|uniref:Uncharacterized protein n=1 Tax=Medioppia subpectinata TaxID=1979941 RepID=A0A7R9Q5D4_9ACAR|nr:unnamed protein product [Medioppia subpectinata]CAG2112654.1 unnamed protein product [Medioppia subpectinata]